MITEEKIGYIKSLTADKIDKKKLIELFSKKVERYNGKIKITDAYCKVTDKLTLKPKELINVTKNIETTVGLYIFNTICIVDVFNDKVNYINDTINNKVMKELTQTITNSIIKGKITSEEFGKFQEKVLWLGYQSELFVPGMSPKLKYPLDSVQKRKKELFEKYKDDIKNGNYIVVADKIEPELLELAKKELKDEPGFELYNKGGKPSFDNNYKNMQVMIGPIKNLHTGEYEISQSNLTDGYSNDEQHLFAGLLIDASYNRAVTTQDGGAYVKFLAAALQSVELDKEGSDCNTKLLKKVTLTKENKGRYIWKYFKESINGELILLTDENINAYIGKELLFRTMIFCKTDKYCNKCSGELSYSLGIKSIGLSAIRVPSTFLNLALKRMHDTTVKVTRFNPEEFFVVN